MVDVAAKVLPIGADALNAWEGFLRAHAGLMEVLERELQDGVGLPLTWYDVLVQLSAAPEGRLRMQDLAAAIVLSKSGLTRLVDRLEQNGFVVRVSCPSDRRGTFAQITPAGRRALEEASPVHLRGVREHFAEVLSAREIAVLRSAASKLLTALQQVQAEGCPTSVTTD
jgi:DNA-binding MarR family transcriptional regulator